MIVGAFVKTTVFVEDGINVDVWLDVGVIVDISAGSTGIFFCMQLKIKKHIIKSKNIIFSIFSPS